ncbi:hypothetical protein ACF0H5_002379 [Mactra antiquata]
MATPLNDAVRIRPRCGLALVRAPMRKSDTQEATSFERHGIYNRSFIEPQNQRVDDYDDNHWLYDRKTPYNRSFSQPGEDRKEVLNEYTTTDNSLMYRRSSSQPKPRPRNYFDVNQAIHQDIMSNPWATCRRQPRKTDRYALYIPSQDEQDNYSERQDFSLPTNPTHSGCDYQPFNNDPSVLYGTYRRAPRTYPRLDVEHVKRRVVKTEYEQPWGTWNIARERKPVYDLTEEKKVINPRVVNDIKTCQQSTNRHSSVKHLFPVPLKDVRTLNSGTTCVRSSLSDKNKNIKKIENNLHEPNMVEKDLKRGRGNAVNKKDGNKTDKTEHKKPFFYCRWITNYPKTFFLITLGGHILIALVTIITLLVGYDLFPTEFEFLPMYDLKVPWMKRDFAWRFRHEYKERYVRKWYMQGLNKWYRSMSYDRANIVLYYDTGGDNIFTKQNLQHMEHLENKIAQSKNYTEYCMQTALLKCEKMNSILRYFDGTYKHIDPVFDDPSYNNIPKVLHAANTNKHIKGDFAYFMAQDHSISESGVYARVTRTLIPMGYPIKLEQKVEEMEKEMEMYLANNFKPVIDEIRREERGFHVIYWSFLLFKHEIVIQIFYDLILAFGSVLFIFGFIVYHTKSLWISSFSVTSILSCFLCTNIIYRVVLDFRYFGFFHVITLFIILGIGADDLFVFLDVWKDTEFRSFPSLAHRLSSAYRKSMKSMFFTSLTTTVAFFVSGFSPLLATKSFGVFAGILVIVNYLSVVIYFPTVVILHHLYFKDWNWPCFAYLCKNGCLKNLKLNPHLKKTENKHISKKPNGIPHRDLYEDNCAIDSTGHRYNVVGKLNPAFKASEDDEYGFVKFKSDRGACNGVMNDAICENGTATIVGDIPSSNTNNTNKKEKEKKLLVRFFRNQYFWFVTHWLVKWIIISSLILVVILSAYSVTKMETENEPAQFYRNSHNYGKALDLDFNGFVANKNDRNVIVYIVWGLRERDMSTCHFSDPRCIGEERLDMTFDPNTEEAQIALKKFCDKLLSFNNEQIDHFKIRRDFLTSKPEIKCFASDMDRQLKKESTQMNGNLSLPWSYRKTLSFMQSKSDIYNTLLFDSTFPHVFEIPISYWLNDGYKFKNKETFLMYQDLIGEGISNYSSPLKTDYSVFYGNRIVYIGVQVNLTLGRFSTGYPEGKPVLDRWETFVQNEVQRMPPGLQNGFQLTKDYWHNLSVQKTIEDSAIQGIVIGILLAFPILTIATRNVIIGLFATLSMCCSTVCVIGIIPLAGWKLGLLEALNMCMVVGLTVDYVVHLAEGYHMSKHTDRKSRVQDMLEVMGISVFSGACTTLGASIFMFFAQIQFIIKFGMFMFCTIGFSLIYSLGFFTTLMGVIGPEGDRGSIDGVLRTIKYLLLRPCSNQRI